MKIILSRDRNNEFFIPDSYIYKNKVRIMAIYENNKVISTSDYLMIGPRRIKMLKKVDQSAKIFAKILDIKFGNQLVNNR